MIVSRSTQCQTPTISMVVNMHDRNMGTTLLHHRKSLSELSLLWIWTPKILLGMPGL